MQNSTKRICLWSGPRNISTALMYSFAQRSDTRVFDEPLYAHYLANTAARAYHPGAHEILATMENDGEKVVRDIIMAEYEKPALFFKMMTHHLIGLDRSFLQETINIILIRDPREMLPSYRNQVEKPQLHDVGYQQNVELYNFLVENGQNPSILDAKQTLLNPRAILIKLCDSVNIAFEESMLSWVAGKRPEDGVWAKYWYDNVHQSCGFQAYKPKQEAFPAVLKPLLAACLPYYEQLYEKAITA